MNQAIAIVGVGAHFPGSTDATGFWRDIVAGRDLLREIPPSHWLIEDYYDPDPQARDKTYARRAAVLDPIPFDALEWGLPPNIVEATDTSQLLALLVARETLEDATRRQAEFDRSRVGVILGVTSAQELAGSLQARLEYPVWVKAMREAGLPEEQVQAICQRIADHYPEWQESSFPGLLGNVIAGRVTNRLDLNGPNCVVDAACASSLAALSMAVTELRLGKADMMLGGGVDTLTNILTFMCFSKTPALSPTGEARPFSDRADGTMLGEGLGMFALKRLTDAEAAGDPIYAVLRGIGSSSDGRAKSIYAPTPRGQALALRRAYEEAGYSPATVGLMEGHGTGTLAGDAAEVAALREVFAADREGPWCALGSVKSQIGHTKAAAGAAGMFKAMMALHHGVIPPTLHVERPNPSLEVENSPFYLARRPRPWIRPTDHPRRASVSALGFGGSNFHVTLEAWEGKNRERLPMGAQLIVLCADSSPALAKAAREAAELATQADGLAWLAQQDRYDPTAAARLALVAACGEEARDRLRAAADRMTQTPEQPFVLPDGTALGHGAPESGELALLFPGQGSQYVDMGAEAAMQWDCARAVWESVESLGDRPLSEVVFPLPGFAPDQDAQDRARLQDTRWAQPAITACSAALLPLLERIGLRATHFAGHSLGEFSALHAAGGFDARQLARIAHARGEAMHQAAQGQDGAMLVARAAADAIAAALEGAALGAPAVTFANFNHPAQVVLSGTRADLTAAEQALVAAGVECRWLPTSGAFHSPLVASASGELETFLQSLTFAPLTGQAWSNTGEVWPSQPSAASLARQLAEPVRFQAMIEAMHAAGVRTFVEVGPDAVLTGLVGKILEDKPHRAVALDRAGQGAQALLAGLARLVAAGVPFEPHRLTDEHRRARDPRRQKPPALPIPIAGCNHGKLYPPPEGAAGLPPPNPPRQEAPPKPHEPPAPPASAPSPVNAPSQNFTPPLPPLGAPASPTAPPGVDPHWLETQRLAAEGHAAFQQALTQSFNDFLRAMEGAHAPPGPPSVAASPPSVAAPRPPAPSTSAPEPPPAPAQATKPKAEPVAAEPTAAPAGEALDLEALLLSVVAERTGYPADLVNLDMDIEGDLGIDSIKKVEILAEAQERIPDLPSLNVEHVGRLRTLRAVLAHLQALLDPSATDEPAEPQAETRRWNRLVVDSAPLPLPGQAMPGLLEQTVWVVGEASFAAQVAGALQAAGEDARAVEELPPNARAVVFLAGLQSDAECMNVLEQALATAQVLAANGPGLWLAVGLAAGVATAGLDGLARGLCREYPELAARTLAVDPRAVAELGELVTQELLQGGDAAWAEWHADERRGRVLRPQAVTPAQPVIHAGDVVVVSGGARGVTAACVLAWARAGVCLALLGSQPPSEVPESLAHHSDEAELIQALAQQAPQPRNPRELRQQARAILRANEIQRTLARIHALGGQASYHACDVTDPMRVNACLHEIRQDLGPIRGLIHAAGVLADRPLLELPAEAFRQVVQVKLDGLDHLLAACPAEDLRLVVGFGSVSGIFGNRGQVAYAAANAAMNQRLAQWAREHPHARVACLAWGPWEGGMVTPALARVYREQGVELIPLDAGGEAFVRELESEDALTRVLTWGDPSPLESK